MACFLVPVAEAVIVTVASKVAKSKEESPKLALFDGTGEKATRIPFSTKLGWLCKLLWGGSALLAFEHLWNGEIVPFPPFLTAADGISVEMLKEMGSVGLTMALFVTVAWACILLVFSLAEKKVLAATRYERESA